MSNQPWKTDKWFVSPWNFDEAVQKPAAFPEADQISRYHVARRGAADRRHLHQGRQDQDRGRPGGSRSSPDRSRDAGGVAQRRSGDQGNREAEPRSSDFRFFPLHGRRREARRRLRRVRHRDGSALERAHHQVRVQVAARKGHRSFHRIDRVRARAGARSRVLPNRLHPRGNEMGARSDHCASRTKATWTLCRWWIRSVCLRRTPFSILCGR